MILIVTNARDLTTDYVVLELQQRGAPYYRFNTERLPEARVTLGMTSAEDWSICLDGREISGREISGAYFRRPGAPEIDSAIIEPGERSYCVAEWEALLKSLYLRIGDRWLNSPTAIGLAEDKPRQLLLARSLGFDVPDAIVTNSPSALSRFLDGPASVAKPLREALLDGEAERVIFTSRVDKAAERDARSIAAAPMILQREVHKEADVRVTVVGDQTFAAQIYSQEAAESVVDWRRGDSANLRHEPIGLPPDVRERCVQLVAALGLRFGAIDLIKGLDGKLWFLEINPNGQWAWIESRTGHRIAAAIVDQLVERTVA